MESRFHALMAARARVRSANSFCTRGRLSPDGLQLGFAAVDVVEIRRGVRELAAALERR